MLVCLQDHVTVMGFVLGGRLLFVAVAIGWARELEISKTGFFF